MEGRRRPTANRPDADQRPLGRRMPPAGGRTSNRRSVSRPGLHGMSPGGQTRISLRARRSRSRSRRRTARSPCHRHRHRNPDRPPRPSPRLPSRLVAVRCDCPAARAAGVTGTLLGAFFLPALLTGPEPFGSILGVLPAGARRAPRVDSAADPGDRATDRRPRCRRRREPPAREDAGRRRDDDPRQRRPGLRSRLRERDDLAQSLRVDARQVEPARIEGLQVDLGQFDPGRLEVAKPTLPAERGPGARRAATTSRDPRRAVGLAGRCRAASRREACCRGTRHPAT